MPQGAIPFPFGDCRICFDKATGVHYGVNTCEGCKGFFKRSIPKAGKYKCFFGGMCQVNAQNRNRCKACRFQRCVQAGMSMDAVKMGRIPKVEKERALEARAREDDIKTENSTLINNFMGQTPENPSFLPPNGIRGFQSPDDKSNVQNRAFGNDEKDVLNIPPRSEMLHTTGNEPMRHDPPLHGNYDPNMPFPGQSPIGDYLERPLAAVTPTSVHHPHPPPSHFQERLRFHPAPGVPPPQQLLPHLNPHMVGIPRAPFPPSDLPSVSSPESEQASPVRHMLPPRNVELPPAGHFEANWGESMRRLSETRNGCGSDSGYSNEGSDPNHPSPNDIDCGNNSSSIRVDPTVDTTDTVASLPDMQIPSSIASRLWLEKDQNLVMNQSENGPNMAGFEASTSGTGNSQGVPILQRSMSESSVTLKLSQLNTRRDSLTSPEGSQSDNPPNPTPPRTPDPFGPTVLRELFHQVFRSPDRIDSMQNRLKDLIREVPADQYQKLIMTFLDEAAKHIPSASVSGLRRSPDGPISGDEFIAAKRMRQSGTNDTNSGHFNPYVGFSSQGERLPIKEENTANDSLYGHINCKPSQSDQSFLFSNNQNGQQIKTELDSSVNSSMDTTNHSFSSFCNEPVVVCQEENNVIMSPTSAGSSQAEELEGDQFSFAMIRSTFKKLQEAEGRQFVRVREKLDISRRIRCGQMKRHPLNDITQATYKQVKEVWDALFSGVASSNKMVIGICRDVPGFNNLNADDQATLMEACYFDIWMLTQVPFISNNDSEIMTDTHNIMYTRFWMRHVLPETLIDKMINFGMALSDMKLSLVQLYILCALQLTDPDRKNLKDVSEVQLLNNHFLDVLAFSVRESHPSNHHRVLVTVFKLLPLLSDINDEQHVVVGEFSIDRPPRRCEALVIPGSMEDCLREEEEAKKREAEMKETNSEGPKDSDVQTSNSLVTSSPNVTSPRKVSSSHNVTSPQSMTSPQSVTPPLSMMSSQCMTPTKSVMTSQSVSLHQELNFPGSALSDHCSQNGDAHLLSSNVALTSPLGGVLPLPT